MAVSLSGERKGEETHHQVWPSTVVPVASHRLHLHLPFLHWEATNYKVGQLVCTVHCFTYNGVLTAVCQNKDFTLKL